MEKVPDKFHYFIICVPYNRSANMRKAAATKQLHVKQPDRSWLQSDLVYFSILDKSKNKFFI